MKKSVLIIAALLAFGATISSCNKDSDIDDAEPVQPLPPEAVQPLPEIPVQPLPPAE
ncbi:hypothetical protein [Aureibacter tunicatorum]|uniref:Lipoprotein n=1 Tax=Aureibacter tunicatorum TaxID=866807 RepID=A0AAE4BRD3_9BACT|nr:hypothetical protein [Aureibacter tunicatorum]MDR6237655.1 hypothetical protein [Aureibacter tunicatorum]BDD02690.1 hypothetical protein AUTU_01730 [Aureibacter tunicatorum]